MLYSFCFGWSQRKPVLPSMRNLLISYIPLKILLFIGEKKMKSSVIQTIHLINIMVAKDTTTDKVGNNWIFNG